MGDWDLVMDTVIVGSGGGGMVASVVARDRGFDVLVIEKTEYLGGSTALSGGGIWIPNNPLMKAVGVADSEAEALTYFEAVVGDVGPASSMERRTAYVTKGPQMISYLQSLGVRLQHCEGWADYYSEYPGGSKRGRTVEPRLFDLKQLGPWEKKLRAGLRFGGLTATTREWLDMSYWNRGVRPFLLSARVVFRTVFGKARGKALMGCGAGLIAQVLKVAVDRGAQVWTDAAFREFVVEDGRVVGVVVRHEGKDKRIAARHGVLLAAGGFAHDPEMREKYFGFREMAEWSGASPGDTGEVLKATMELGADTDLLDQAIWDIKALMPDGSRTTYKPLSRAGLARSRMRPGTIMVDWAGHRFCNETASYMEVGRKMLARNSETKAVPSWLIFDDTSRRRYILGWFPGRLPEQWIKDGFVKRADTLEALARQCGIDAAGLQATIDRFNKDARVGVDTEFHRGESTFDRFMGDPYHKPNESLAPIEKGPFYAIAMFPSDVGTFGGVLTDEYARVLREDGQPIPGLYATGVITASLGGRHYLGAGASVGPTCTFGYIAMNDMADRADRTNVHAG